MIVTINISNIPPSLLPDYQKFGTQAGDVISIDNECDGYQQIVKKRNDALRVAATLNNHMQTHPPMRVDPSYDPTNPEHVQRGKCNC